MTGSSAAVQETQPPTQVAMALDDARDFAACFISAPDTVIDVIALWAAHTHVLDCFYTSPRLLFTGENEQCGKTEAESMALRLSANPWTVNKETTRDGLRSKFDVAEARLKPVIGIQEVSDIFGQSGRGGGSHPVNTYLRTGYKDGETLSVSRSGVAVDIDVYHGCVMAGLKNAVPKDIRSRCIVVHMTAGEPEMYYMGRECDPMALDYRLNLGRQLRQHTDELTRFRVPAALDPRLVKRLRELWEPLFAIAHVAGGSWPRRVLAAFRDLAANQATATVLSAPQKILRDMSRAAAEIGAERVAGADLIGEMRRYGEQVYRPLTDRALAMFMAQAMRPVQPVQFRTDDGRTVRGYESADIARVAAERMPAADDDGDEDALSLADESTIFDVAEVVTGDDTMTSDVATATT